MLTWNQAAVERDSLRQQRDNHAHTIAVMLAALEMVASRSRRLHPEEESQVREAIALARGN